MFEHSGQYGLTLILSLFQLALHCEIEGLFKHCFRLLMASWNALHDGFMHQLVSISLTVEPPFISELVIAIEALFEDIFFDLAHVF